MGRKKRYQEGKIYITNDSLFSHDGYSKANRRVVVLNNDKTQATVCRIKALKDKDGKVREKLIPIENYPCLTKPSGVEPYLKKQTVRGSKFNVNKMKPTTSRLNKWDMKKVKNGIKK